MPITMKGANKYYKSTDTNIQDTREGGKSPETIEIYVGGTFTFVAFLEENGIEFNGEMKRFYTTSS